MLSGKDNSGFGWDEYRQMVVAEDVAWNSYIITGKDAQTVANIVEEIDAKDVATTNNLEEGNNYRGCEDDVSLDEMDVLATQSQPTKPNQDSSTSSKKKQKIFLMEVNKFLLQLLILSCYWGKTYGLLALN
ncbi:hypothetical protein Gogos_015244 [Gossypium gossypioides]|uniref:Myb/SANT-like domain-containing protein n=1 Tax=Gossypium gossypioides TaxID=34282 RepID=A0A7J9C117_GOSGO|nr:hypothetical protein [Gossypium gossypioides]